MTIELTVARNPGLVIWLPCPNNCGEWLEPQAGCDVPIPPEAYCEKCDDIVYFDTARFEEPYEYPGVLRITGAVEIYVEQASVEQ